MRRESNFFWQVVRGIARIMFVVLALLAIWYLTRLETFTIQEVTVLGGETISHDEVQSLIKTELTGAYSLIVPKRFSYLYPHDRLVEVVERIPRVHSVVVMRVSRSVLQITFEEYTPGLLWCSSHEADALCWLVSDTGYAFGKAPMLRGGTLVRHVVEGNREIQEGQVIDRAKLASITSFIARAEEELLFRITSLTHRLNGDIELVINGGGTLLVSGGKDLNTTFENLKIVLASPEFKHLEPGNFKYIDVRFDNKVFVNENLIPIDSGTSTNEEGARE